MGDPNFVIYPFMILYLVNELFGVLEVMFSLSSIGVDDVGVHVGLGNVVSTAAGVDDYMGLQGRSSGLLCTLRGAYILGMASFHLGWSLGGSSQAGRGALRARLHSHQGTRGHGRGGRGQH